MFIWDELRSANSALYGQYCTLLSIGLLLFMPFFFSFALMFVLGSIMWAICALCCVIEFTISQKVDSPLYARACLLCRNRWFGGVRSPLFRTIAYALYPVHL